ncbi:MAG: hemerythrin domain-containing protein [Myxococcota bacterium]
MEIPGDSGGSERWWQEHSELDQRVRELEEAIESQHIGAANAALERLTEAIEAHFEVEEAVYFPLVERFSPSHVPAVKAARLGHAQIREVLEDLRNLVEQGQIVAARGSLRIFLTRFQSHEAREAQMIRDLSDLEEVRA